MDPALGRFVKHYNEIPFSRGAFLLEYLKNIKKMKKLFQILILFSYCFLASSSNVSFKGDEIVYQKSLNKKIKDMSVITQFTLDFLSRCIQQDENAVCSPISVHSIFTLLTNGVEGEGLKNLELILGDSAIKLNEYYRNLFGGYQFKGLAFSNILWIDKNLFLSDLFLDKCNDFPLTQIKNIDFSNKIAKDIINEYVDNCTNHTIKNIIEHVDPNDRLIVTSTLYFKSDWIVPFFKENNIIDKFFSSKGNVTQIEYMQNESNYRYFEDKKSKVLILPYEKSDFSFFLLLPNKNILLKDYIQTISGKELLNILQNGQKNYTAINLCLPKFRIEYSSNNLTNMLVEMGFNLMSVNFSNILNDKGDLYLRNIYQKTFLSIDENGTEASSATVVYMDGYSRIKKKLKPIKLEFNRPFIFGILENQTNIPLFIGAINEL